MSIGHAMTVPVRNGTGDGDGAMSFSHRAAAPGPSTNAVTETP